MLFSSKEQTYDSDGLLAVILRAVAWVGIAVGVSAFAVGKQLVQILESPNPTSEGMFGLDLATDGEVLVVGAPYEAHREGNAYIYQRRPQGAAGWDLVAQIAPPTTVGQEFGECIEYRHSTCMISALHGTASHVGNGLVYCYDLSTPATPSLTQVLFPSVSTSVTTFGAAMASTDRWLAISATRGTGPSNRGAGVVYIFEYQQGLWVEKYRVEPNDGVANDQFGKNLALDGDRLLVHANRTSFQGDRIGCAYLFELESFGATQIQRFDWEHVGQGLQTPYTFPNRMHIQGDELLLSDSSSRTGVRYVRNPATGVWDWAETSAALTSLLTYPSGTAPAAVYVGIKWVRPLSAHGILTLHRTDGVWESCGKILLPDASTLRPAFTTGFNMEFAGGQALSGAIFYPPPPPGFLSSPGSVFIWDLDPDFFDPGDCFTGGRVHCSAERVGGVEPCPCGTLPAGDNTGCQNSTGQGGRLRGMGDASYEFQTMRLQASQLPPQTTVLYQWAMWAPVSLAPVVAGAGVNCLGGGIVGSAVMMSDPMGIATLDNPDLPQPMSSLLGSTVMYQAFYRDQPTATCPHGFNATNAMLFKLRQ